MKKFFTLIFALLIAGSVCASDYLYIEDFEIDRSTWQATVPLKAHFEDYVSAIQVELTLPVGMVVHTIPNEYELTIEHENRDGVTVDYYPTVAENQHGTVIHPCSESSKKAVSEMRKRTTVSKSTSEKISEANKKRVGKKHNIFRL